MDLDLLFRTSTFLLTALLLTRVLSRGTAATRHLVWHAAVVAVLLAPAARLVAPRFTVGVPSWMSGSFTQQTRDTISVGPTERCDRAAASQCSPGEEIQSVPRLDAFAAIAGAGTWIVGAWFLFGWLASAWQTTRATDAPAEWVIDVRRLAARMGLSHLPAVRQARDPGSPRVAGFLRPVILVPSSAREWAASDRVAALVHELSHIRRSDRRTQACAQLVCALYWFNPLTWIAARALARERERACDDAVLSAGIRPSSYASLLLDLAKGEHAWTTAAALGMARPSTIEGRLLAILATDTRTTSTSPRRLSPGRSTRWLVIAGATIVVGAVLGARQQQPSPIAETSPGGRTQPNSSALMRLDTREDATPITKALTRALADPDRQVREKAALGLAFVPGRETIDPLLTALRDPDAQVREKAAIGLTFRRDARIVDPLLDAMGDSDAQVREKVAIALGASGDARAVTALEKALEDPDSQVREKAASGLILLGLRK